MSAIKNKIKISLTKISLTKFSHVVTVSIYYLIGLAITIETLCAVKLGGYFNPDFFTNVLDQIFQIKTLTSR